MSMGGPPGGGEGPPAGSSTSQILYPPEVLTTEYLSSGVRIAPLILGLTWTLHSVAAVVVALRIFARTKQKNGIGMDDYLIIMAVIVSMVEAITDTLEVHYGLGRPSVLYDPHAKSQYEKFLLASETLNFVGLFFMRASVCFFSLRLLRRAKSWLRYVIYAALVLNFISTLVNLLSFLLQCRPLDGLWNAAAAIHADCYSYAVINRTFTAAGVLSTIVDFMVVAVPILVVRELQIDPKHKVAIIVLLALSLLTAASGIGKIIAVHLNISFARVGPTVQTISIVEEQCGIIFASLPGLNQFFIWARRRIRGERTTSSGRSRTYVTPSGALSPLSPGIKSPSSPGLRSGRFASFQPGDRNIDSASHGYDAFYSDPSREEDEIALYGPKYGDTGIQLKDITRGESRYLQERRMSEEHRHTDSMDSVV